MTKKIEPVFVPTELNGTEAVNRLLLMRNRMPHMQLLDVWEAFRRPMNNIPGAYARAIDIWWLSKEPHDDSNPPFGYPVIFETGIGGVGHGAIGLSLGQAGVVMTRNGVGRTFPTISAYEVLFPHCHYIGWTGDFMGHRVVPFQ